MESHLPTSPAAGPTLEELSLALECIRTWVHAGREQLGSLLANAETRYGAALASRVREEGQRAFAALDAVHAPALPGSAPESGALWGLELALQEAEVEMEERANPPAEKATTACGWTYIGHGAARRAGAHRAQCLKCCPAPYPCHSCGRDTGDDGDSHYCPACHAERDQGAAELAAERAREG